MKYFSVIMGLFFIFGVISTGCEKGEQTPEPNVQSETKSETEKAADNLKEVGEKSEAAVEEAVQDLKETAETVKEEAVETMEEAKEKTKEIVETSKKEAGDAYQDAAEQVKGVLNQ